MSDQSQGPGWWLASDGKWYPPETAPGAVQPPAPPAAKPPVWKRTWVVVTGIVVLLLIVAAALSSGDDDKPAASDGSTTTSTLGESTTTEGATTTERATTTTSASEDGTRENPYPIGTEARVGDWTVTVIELRDGTADVTAANQFNDPPPDGSIYVLVRVKATYNGDDEGSPGFDLSMDYIGNDSRVYTDSDCGAVAPDDLFDQPAVVAGGTVEGNQCLLMPASVFGTGAVSVGSTLSFDDDAVWWA